MGLPLSPTLANVFMCFHEKTWLSECPDSFRPIFYRRYVDDTFILFRDKSHASQFLDYMNSRHVNINFTMETEVNDKLSFLDVLVSRSDSKFNCSVYRKDTFSGVCTSFFSFCSLRLKTNCITTLLNRAYRICSSYSILHDEIAFLRNFFQNNGFPRTLFDSKVKQFLNSKFSDSFKPLNNSDSLYFSLPYFGAQSDKFKVELVDLLRKYFVDIDFKFIFTNNFKLGTLFNYKDRLSKCHRTSLVYKFSCAQCASEYVGMTTRTLGTRVSEHCGRSHRTGRMLACPPHSAIRDHSEACGSRVTLDNFSILNSTSNPLDLRILESLYIFKLKPTLNNDMSSFPLRLVNK